MKRIGLCVFLAAFTTVLYSQEEVIGWSFYDLQTNGSCQNRIYVFDDGTIGAAWTQSYDPYTYPDRGTGYNYYNGTDWQPIPTERIESQRSGWPSYAPLGENGELIVSHLSYADTVGLLFNRREDKGEGEWEENLFLGPTGNDELFWPRMVTGGENHTSVFMLALTAPIANGGDIYQGLDGALLYSHSTNSGETWDIHNQILPGMDSTEYNGFPGDCYAFAEPKDNIIAFVVGSHKNDLFLMKSIDQGMTFEKTIIWDNPYDTILPADTFFCVDGSVAVAIEAGGKAHVAFGITNYYYDNNWFGDRSIDGIGYWNEDRPVFSSDVNALNPDGSQGSEMVLDYNLIGWAQDINGDDTITYHTWNSFGYCNHYSVSSMVQLVIDDSRIFLVYTSVTETYDNGMDNYRRLWSRPSLDGGETWGQFYHFFANDTTTIFNEYAFPSCAAHSNDYIHLIVMIDWEPGIYNCPSENSDGNYFQYIKIPKDEIVGLNKNIQSTSGFDVFQNFPNPFSESTIIKVNLQKPVEIKLEVINILGEKVYELPASRGNVGLNSLTIKADNFTSGIYFYTVTVGLNKITKKMIIK